MLLDRLDRFRSFVTGKRDQISALALKLDQIQMPQQAKPSFDLIFKTKTKHTRVSNLRVVFGFKFLVVIGGDGGD
jgi:hypothetical protein